MNVIFKEKNKNTKFQKRLYLIILFVGLFYIQEAAHSQNSTYIEVPVKPIKSIQKQADEIAKNIDPIKKRIQDSKKYFETIECNKEENVVNEYNCEHFKEQINSLLLIVSNTEKYQQKINNIDSYFQHHLDINKLYENEFPYTRIEKDRLENLLIATTKNIETIKELGTKDKKQGILAYLASLNCGNPVDDTCTEAKKQGTIIINTDIDRFLALKKLSEDFENYLEANENSPNDVLMWIRYLAPILTVIIGWSIITFVGKKLFNQDDSLNEYTTIKSIEAEKCQKNPNKVKIHIFGKNLNKVNLIKFYGQNLSPKELDKGNIVIELESSKFKTKKEVLGLYSTTQGTWGIKEEKLAEKIFCHGINVDSLKFLNSMIQEKVDGKESIEIPNITQNYWIKFELEGLRGKPKVVATYKNNLQQQEEKSLDAYLVENNILFINLENMSQRKIESIEIKPVDTNVKSTSIKLDYKQN